MRFLAIIFLSTIATGLYAQNFEEKGTVYLYGKVINSESRFFEFAQTGFFKTSSSSVLLEDDGSFSHRLQIEGKQQDVYLYLNDDAITLTVKDGDSLQIQWDGKNFKQSFDVKGSTILSDKMAKAQVYRYFNFRPRYLDLSRDIRKKDSLNKEQKFRMINNLFNEESNYILGGENSEAVSMILYPEIYFLYTNLLRRNELLPEYPLALKLVKPLTKAEQLVDKTSYTWFDAPFFWTSNSYRNFLFDNTRFNREYKKYYDTVKTFNPTLCSYLAGKSIYTNEQIEGWFNTKNILFSFNFYNFAQVENVFNMFNAELKVPGLKKILEDGYIAFRTLKPGSLAPVFTLKNAAGESISLSDFKGKVVYLDFWGVGCGPCIYDIENYAKEIHERYKNKEVVFISVCVDSNEKQWKRALEKYKMRDQVNLIAEGWAEHPVVKKYNVEAIPHYFLIGKDGRIINNNAGRMGELLKREQNEIDKAL